MAKTFGDPSKLSTKNFSARAKKSMLRGDKDGDGYKKGGSVIAKPYAKGGRARGK